MISGQVLWNDPESNDEDLRETVTVVLDNGFKVDFFLLGLSESEYIERTNQIYELENGK